MLRGFSKAVIKKLDLKIYSTFSLSQDFSKKFAEKKYKEILGLQQKKDLKEINLHHAYLQQIKKYHSDNIQDEQVKKEYQQITKYIISAYKELQKQQKIYKPSIKSILSEEEDISQRIFGQSYDELKYKIYAPGNEEMRKKFFQELQKVKKSKNSQNQERKKEQPNNQRPFTYTSSPSSQQSDGSLGKFLGILAACGLLLIPFLSKKEIKQLQVKQQHKVRQYTEKQYDIMAQNSRKILWKPFEDFYNALIKRRPHMIIYPVGQDPHILQQLTKYSIAPDIHLYQIPSKYLLDQVEYNKLKTANKTDGIEKYELTQTKPNTLLTLSLEAQRNLHNIYVKVDDVLSEIKQTGKFVPPKVLFRFHGYIMFQIRDKPFSTLQCYKNSKYISLFDLYFDYYSPIFFKRDHFREYLTGYEHQNPHKNNRYFGNVYLNYRQIPNVYLEKGEKVVIMKDPKKTKGPNGLIKQKQLTYIKTWENYYARFQKNWKNYCQHQKQGTIIY